MPDVMLKWLPHFMVIPLMGCLLVAGATLADPDTRGAGIGVHPVIRTSLPPSIDGTLDDACWAAAERLIKADFIHGSPGDTAEATPLLVRLTWDTRYLYIGYTVRRVSSEAEADPDGDDTSRADGFVEFFIKFPAVRHFMEVHHHPDNTREVIRATVRPPGLDLFGTSSDGIRLPDGSRLMLDRDEAFSLRAGVRQDVDGTYHGELAVPWTGLRIADEDIPVKPGDTFRFLAVYAATGSGNRYYHSSPDMPPGWFHQHTRRWNICRLEDAHD